MLFNKHLKKMDVPLEFIFDSEALLEKCDDGKTVNLSGGDKGSKTRAVNRHVLSGYCCQPVFKYPETMNDEMKGYFNLGNSGHALFSGEGCSGDFIYNIYESIKFYFENVDMNKPIRMTYDDWQDFNTAEECHMSRRIR